MDKHIKFILFFIITSLNYTYSQGGIGIGGSEEILDPEDNGGIPTTTFVWYRDLDADGYGNKYVLTSTSTNVAPLGFVSNKDDCNDNDPTVTIPIKWYLDNDGDGYGNRNDGGVDVIIDPTDPFIDPNGGDTTTDNFILSCTQPVGYANNRNDCDDTNPNINVLTWYMDADQDGFGDPNNSTNSIVYGICIPPYQFVANNLDCDDGNSNLNPNTSWYIDSNDDGVYDVGLDPFFVGCSPPTSDYLIVGHDYNLNWTHSVSYDVFGNISGIARTYFDDLGKANVSLSKDMMRNTTWRTETTYDSFGRPFKTSFPAVTPNSFEKIDVLSNPTAYNNYLKYYYGDTNTLNPFQSTATHPYSEVEYDKLNPGNTIRGYGGNQINGEWKTGYSFTVPAAQEMYYVFGHNYYDGTVNGTQEEVITKFYKSVSIDPHGVETVGFTDGEGKTLAVARSTGSTVSYPVISTIGTQGFVDVYIPAGISASSISFLGGQSLYKIYNLKSGGLVTSVTPGNAYRIEAVSIPLQDYKTYINQANGEIEVEAGALGIRYNVNYYDYSLNYYDKTGRLNKTIQPNGFDVTAINTGKVKATTNHTFATTYKYNTLGQLIETTSPDEGTSRFAYRKDGQIRFSQSAIQVAQNKISYTNYDTYGRPYESGVLTTTTLWSSLSPDTAALPGGTRTEQTLSVYDFVGNSTGGLLLPILSYALNTNGFNADNYIPHNLDGNVVTSWSNQSQSWYSYDLYGRVEWMVQNIQGLGVKTIHYHYDAKGNVKRVVYQKDKASELFVHQYTYNFNGALESVSTSTNGSLNGITNINATGNASVSVQNNALAVTTIAAYSGAEKVLRTNAVVNEKLDVRLNVTKGNTDKLRIMVVEVNPTTGQWNQSFKGYVTNNGEIAFSHTVSQYPKVYLKIDKDGSSSDVDTATNFTINNLFVTLDSDYEKQADYEYYVDGKLKRVVLAEGIQGTDYVYTLGGMLKSINHPSLDASKDPGGDNNDVFGITLDYYSGDYIRPSQPQFASAPTVPGVNQDNYDGNIKASRFATRSSLMDLIAPTTIQSKAYAYTYNNNKFLTNATFGTIQTDNSIQPQARYREGGLQYDANGNIRNLRRTDQNGVAIDNFVYNYIPGTNQLSSVSDIPGPGLTVAAVSALSNTDIDNQPANNYVYNSIGQLTDNIQEGLKYFYNTQGLVIEVKKNNYPAVKFYYNERGSRIKKESFLPNSNTVQSTAYYVLNASGNTLANYTNSVLQELPVYGGSRLGAYNKSGNFTNYQITDHLGNVRAVIRKNGTSTTPLLQQYADYYPFGEQLPSRNSFGGYMYAYQGQELDPETGMEAFKLRLWDGRIGRWLSPDPYGQYASPYLGMGNNPISMIDPDGGFACRDHEGNIIDCPKGYENYSATMSDHDAFFDKNGNFEWAGKFIELNSVELEGVYSPKFSLFANYIPELGFQFGMHASIAGDIFAFASTSIYNVKKGLCIPGRNNLLSQGEGWWLGKNSKFYSTTWGGNGFTGGKLKYASKLSSKLGGVSTVLGVYSIFATESEYANGKIGLGRRMADQTANFVGFMGPYGAAANLGYNLGAYTITTETYNNFFHHGPFSHIYKMNDAVYEQRAFDNGFRHSIFLND